MRLRVRDASRLLGVSEKTIYRWVEENDLPFERVNEQLRFNRAELLEWAMSRRMPISPTLLEEPDDASIPSIEDALRTGGIYYGVGGSDKSSALRSVVDALPLPAEVDREFLLEVLLARESVGSTGIGEGIAIPHVRNPVILHVSRPLVALCFLEKDVDFQAIDGKPVHTLFAIVSPTIRAHLRLLSQLAYGLRASRFAEAVARKAPRDEILAAAREWESELVAPDEIGERPDRR